MAKGSVRKKGKKWYYRFYVEDASGNRVQKEFPGTESKSETESLLRKAMEDYETKMFLAQAKNITLGDMLDMWVEEELKPGSLSDGTVTAYINTVSRIKKHPIGKRKLKTVTSDHLQSYMDLLSFGGTSPDGKTVEALSKGSLGQYSAVLQNSFRFAVFPKRLITFNPMQYVVKRVKDDEYELFTEDGTGDLPIETPTISHEQYLALNELLKKKHNPALFPIQIAYFAGLRIGEVCGLTWQDIDFSRNALRIDKTLARISRDAVNQVNQREILHRFPPVSGRQRTVLVLKQPKTESSVRTVYLPPSLMALLKQSRPASWETGGQPSPHLIFAYPDGRPMQECTLTKQFQQALKEAGLPKVTFHSLRYSSISYKLSLSGGDIKAVQRDSGHAQADMITELYGQVLEQNRWDLVERFEEVFYCAD